MSENQSLKLAQAKNAKPTKTNKQKKVAGGSWGVTQAIDHLPSKCKALSSNPNNAKKKPLILYDQHYVEIGT
jgi:hypothetical protein